MKHKRIPLPRPVKWTLFALGVLGVLRVLSYGRHETETTVMPRMEQVQVIDWRSVDQSVRKAFEIAHDKACTYAEVAVARWMKELKQRSEEDFLPWYFSYWNQQALMLKNAGWMLMDTPVLGKQPLSGDQMGAYLQGAFMARVLQPGTAQLRAEGITRKAVEVYLQVLNQELDAVQVEYSVTDQNWERHLDGLSGMLGSIEGNRQVPLVLKGMVAGSTAVGIKAGRAVTEQVRGFLMRRGSRELMEDGMCYGGRVAARGLGWVVFVGFGLWDLYDHHRTVSQNKPVMRRLLNGYFEELENQVLNDPQCGIFQTLETVRQTIARQYKRES